jgi:peptide/nickel transport system permease protein
LRKYIARRFIQNLFTFILFLTMVYILVDAQPGDFGNMFLNDPRLSPAQRQAMRTRLGLDQPVMVRYLTWLKNFVQGDLGVSFSNYPSSHMSSALAWASFWPGGGAAGSSTFPPSGG